MALALKLKTRGMAGYNLRGVDRMIARNYPDLSIFLPVEGKGDILESMEQVHIFYYDQPLHHIPFGFPLALMLSQMVFSSYDEFYALQVAGEREVIEKAPPGAGLRNYRFDRAIAGKQFYSVIVPLSFSLLLVVLVYLLAKVLYENEWAACTAMFLMAISPIDILTAQRVWADDMTAAFAALAVLLYVLAGRKNTAALAFIGGLSCGLSAITKQTGAFIVFVIVLWHFAANLDRLRKKDSFLGVVFDAKLLLFLAGTLVGSGYWFLKVAAVYGDPLYRPRPMVHPQAIGIDWFRRAGVRPVCVYLIGTLYQNPLFALACASPVWLLFRRERLKETLLCILWIAVFLFIFQVYLGGEEAKELRLILPSYPAFAVLGAYMANLARRCIDEHAGYRAGTCLLIIALAASAFWSVPMAMEALFYNRALILKPF